MKLQLKWTTALLVSLSAMTAQAQDAVPVNISGEIADATAGCTVDGGATLDFAFNGTTSDWTDYGDGGEYRFTDVPSDTLEIDCTGADGATDITFQTNDASNPTSGQGCGDNRCTSYSVVFVPDFTTCDASCLANLQQGRVTVNLSSATCDGGACGANTATGVLGGASIDAAAGAVVEASFTGTLIAGTGADPQASSGPAGTVQAQPGLSAPALYVVYQ